MANCRDGKKMLTVEMDEDLYNALKNLSVEYGVGISGTCRMIVLDYLRRYKNYTGKEKQL